MKNSLLQICLFFCTAFTQAQELQTYIETALENNPNIQAFEMRYAIAEEKINEAQWLPNTEFGVGYFLSEPETRTGAQRARFSAKQMLPWFGTIASRKNFASAMADTEYVEYVIAKRKLALSVTQSYYDVYGLQAKQNILEKNMQLLETYEVLALKGVEVGKASTVDVLKLQIRQNELQQQMEILQEQFQAATIRFNNLLLRAPTAPVEVPTEVQIPQEAAFVVDSLEINPELLRFDKMYASVIQEELLNAKQAAPSLGFGLDFIPVQERPDLTFNDNGKDILMPMVALSIPIFNKSYHSKNKQFELRKKEINLQKLERKTVLETTLAKARATRNEAQIAFTTHNKNVQKAKQAEQILIKNYETNTMDFNDLLDIQELQLKFQYNQIQSVQLYFTQAALINYLTQY